MKKKKYLAIFMAMSMATATAPVTALADDATTGTESGAETGESGSGETGSTGETGSENGGTEGGSTTAPDTPAENEGVKTIDELNTAITDAGETETTIKLAADITGDVVIPEDANITIDLNGKKITNSVGHTIMNNGTLTIKGEGTVDNITHGKAALYNKGTVTLNGGTFDRTQENGKSDSSSGGNSYYTIKNVGNMTINEGVNVLTAEGNGELGRFSSLVANGYYNGTTYDNDEGVDNPTLIINNGTFSGGLNTIKNDDRAELTINDGTFKNFYQATVQNHNIATINGGTYKAASDASSTGKETYGVYNCGCGANIDLGTLTVTGGGGGSSVAKYGVTISDSKNGAVTASAAKAETGDKVILTPKADEGYVLDKITAKDKDGKEVKLKAEKDGTYSFTMPKGGVTVDTTFKQAQGAASTDKPAAATKTIILQIGSTAVLVDDQAIINDVAPVIRNDRTLVPIRVITEALGGQVAWNEAAKEVTLTVNGKEIKMTIGKALEKYGVAPVIIGGRTFVPVRFVADELGAVTTWDDATKTVTIQAVK